MYVPSKSGGKSNPVDRNKIKTEMKVEVKEEPLYDLYTVHDNSKHIAKLSEGGENCQLKEESYFDEVCAEMGIDFVTSKTFDKEYLRTAQEQGSKNLGRNNNSNLLDIFCETRKELREDHILASVFTKSDEKTLGVQEKKLYLCGVLFL